MAANDAAAAAGQTAKYVAPCRENHKEKKGVHGRSYNKFSTFNFTMFNKNGTSYYVQLITMFFTTGIIK